MGSSGVLSSFGGITELKNPGSDHHSPSFPTDLSLVAPNVSMLSSRRDFLRELHTETNHRQIPMIGSWLSFPHQISSAALTSLHPVPITLQVLFVQGARERVFDSNQHKLLPGKKGSLLYLQFGS